MDTVQRENNELQFGQVNIMQQFVTRGPTIYYSFVTYCFLMGPLMGYPKLPVWHTLEDEHDNFAGQIG